MARIFYDSDVQPNLLRARRVAIIGYGSQGHAHALNLRDSGWDVRVGLQPHSASRAKATAEGLRVLDVPDAVREADVVMLLTPDTTQGELYREQIAPALKAGATLMFAHGFNVRFGQIEAPDNVDVSMIAPKSPGHRMREVFTQGGGVPAVVAVHRDHSGRALEQALAYAHGVGCSRAGVIESTFAEETETDLFGEQAVLCGGVTELVKAGFDTLVEAGYQPEIAYFECLHELKLIVDLMYQGGLSYMRYSISDTAEWGDYESGQLVVDDSSRAAMRQLLAAIRDGSFAERWLAENAAGRPTFLESRARAREHGIEVTGRQLRAMMPFLDPRTVPEVREQAVPV